MQKDPVKYDETISFIGAGRVGRVLARLFNEKGFRISKIIDQDFKKAQACSMECHAQSSASDPRELSLDTSILFVTVPDDEIIKVAEMLSKQKNLKKGAIIVHTSGSLSSAIFSSIQYENVHLNSAHPCFSFTTGYTGSLEDVYFALEGDGEGCERLKSLFRAIDGKTFIIQPEQKPLYHAACTIASNYLVTLMDFTQQVVDTLDADLDMSYLYPLISGTLENIKRDGIKSALTGPIMRGDIGTVEKHLMILHQKNPDFIPPYTVLGEWAVQMAENMDGDRTKLVKIRTLLQQYSKF